MPWYKALIIKPSIEEEFITLVKIEGREICVVKDGNKIHAFQNRCPHANGALCTGWIDEGKIVCPNHHYRYDIQTGKGQGTQGDFINIYETKIRNDEVYVKVSRSINPFRWIMNLFE